MRRLLLPMCLLSGAAACGDLLGGGDDEPATAPEPAGDAAPEDASEASAGDAGVDAPPVPTCDGRLETVDVPVVADTTLIKVPPTLGINNCYGSASQGGSRYLVITPNLEQGTVALVRVNLTDVLANEPPSPTKLTLRLTRGACEAGTCPAFAPGELLVYPARSDWDEQTPDVHYSGADWCRRLAFEAGAWSAPGASGVADRGPLAATVTYDGTSAELVLEIDWRPLESWTQSLAPRLLTLLVAPKDAAFTADSLQAPDAGGVPPKATLEVCRN